MTGKKDGSRLRPDAPMEDHTSAMVSKWERGEKRLDGHPESTAALMTLDLHNQIPTFSPASAAFLNEASCCCLRREVRRAVRSATWQQCVGSGREMVADRTDVLLLVADRETLAGRSMGTARNLDSAPGAAHGSRTTGTADRAGLDEGGHPDRARRGGHGSQSSDRSYA